MHYLIYIDKTLKAIGYMRLKQRVVITSLSSAPRAYEFHYRYLGR